MEKKEPMGLEHIGHTISLKTNQMFVVMKFGVSVVQEFQDALKVELLKHGTGGRKMTERITKECRVKQVITKLLHRS